MAVAISNVEDTADDFTALGFAYRLSETGKLAPGALERATGVARESGEPLELVLTRLGLIPEREFTESAAYFLGLRLVPTPEFPGRPPFEDRLQPHFLRERRILPLEDRQDGVTIAMANPFDDYAAQAVRFAIGKPVIRSVAHGSDIEAALDRYYGETNGHACQSTRAVADQLRVNADDDLERLKDSASDAPVIRLVSQLIMRAVEARASDIHIEPTPNELRVRYRIDGVLQQIESPPAELASSVLSRIKVMAKLNIAERRLPQDGRIATAVRGHEIDLRVAISPTMQGERATLRILDRSQVSLDFAALGFDESVLRRLRDVLGKPHGVVLVTGPTGSGKTTTLYAALRELNALESNILTIEDPVEYQLAGINQVQVKPQIGLTFANALRSFLRQDPDIMMVGEIRDLETAQIAVQAALTGHLILSTLHTNDAASTITRLLDMGVEDYLITSTLNGVVAQRLVRTLCRACREPYRAIPELAIRLGLEGDELTLYRATGCPACSGSGYRGRSALVEILIVDEALRQAVLRNGDASELQSIALRSGMQSLAAHGVQKARAGFTSLEEVIRVTRVLQ